MSLFNPLVPSGLIKLSTDYKNVQNNFQQLDTSFGVNHFLFSNQTTNNGKHTFVELVNNVSIPTAVAPGELTLYSIQNPSTLATDLYLTPDDDSAQYQLSRVLDSQIANFGATKNAYTPQGGSAVSNKYTGGWTFLPGGLYLQYGFYNNGSIPSGSYIPVVFPVKFTNANKITVWVTPYCKAGGTSESHTASVDYSTISTTGFTCNFDTSTSSYIGFSWQAIGT